MRGAICIAAAALLAGCVATTSFVGPSGSQVHSAKCSVSPNGCYQEASKICHGPYQVLDSDSRAGGVVADIFPALLLGMG